MKILYISALYYPNISGGAEISLQHIVEGMHDRGHDVVMLSTSEKGRMLESETINNIKVYRAGLKNIYWHYSYSRPNKYVRMAWHIKDRYNKAMMPYLREVLSVERPDVVVCHNLTGWSIAVWDEIHKRGLPIVQVLHDFYLMCPNSNMYKNERNCLSQCTACKVLRYGYVDASAKVTSLVAISQHIMENFEKRGYFKKAYKKVIYNYRSIKEPDKLPAERFNKIRYGYIGTLSENKGINLLISTFQELKVDAELLIAGSGQQDYVSYLKSLITVNNIKFCGFVNSDEFYKKIDILIVPSLWEEPLGMVAIEACANHIPVIASARGGLKEIVVEGENGLLFDPDKTDSLKNSILKIYENPALLQHMSNRARKQVGKFLDKDRLLDEYETVYQKVFNLPV